MKMKLGKKGSWECLLYFFVNPLEHKYQLNAEGKKT